jgi:L-ribulose-5-phosphate 3-epimerase
MSRVGFMQGRLSPLIDGRIQSFPWGTWKNEFKLGEQIDIHIVEWTLDHDRLYENPLLTHDGRTEILSLCKLHEFVVPSVTGDCFMQSPFWKAGGAEREKLQQDFLAVAKSCAEVGVHIIVVPLVDNGRLENAGQEDVLVSFMKSQTEYLSLHGLRVAFESDFKPAELARFIGRLNPAQFGVNYDIGNSAALGYVPDEEFANFGQRIINVHVKDRKLGGATVPLGTGDANFEAVFSGLAKNGYDGNYILQTARSANGDHVGALRGYRDMAVNWMKKYES